MIPITTGSFRGTLVPFRFSEKSLENRGKFVDKLFIN
jgi:hypothetical protein